MSKKTNETSAGTDIEKAEKTKNVAFYETVEHHMEIDNGRYNGNIHVSVTISAGANVSIRQNGDRSSVSVSDRALPLLIAALQRAVVLLNGENEGGA